MKRSLGELLEMVMKRICLVLGCLILATGAHARLNESLQQCSKRYGTSTGIAKESGWQTFQKGPYYIEIHFNPASRVADTIAIQRRFHGEPVSMSVEEIKIILAANSNGIGWHESDAPPSAHMTRMFNENKVGSYLWRSRGKASASYDRREHEKVLLISSNPEFPLPPEVKDF